MSLAYVPSNVTAICAVCRVDRGHLFIVDGIPGSVPLCRKCEGLTDGQVVKRLYPDRDPRR